MKEGVECPACSGDGIERCNNPDHGFIAAIGHEIGRLGCPGCGHDEEYRVKDGNAWVKCDVCCGHGLTDIDTANKYIIDNDLDIELYETNKESEIFPSSRDMTQQEIDALERAYNKSIKNKPDKPNRQ